MQKKSANFNPKTWDYFNKYWEIGNNTVANFLWQSEQPWNKKKTHKKPAKLNKLEIMETYNTRIIAKTLLIAHRVHGQREGAINFADDILIQAELLHQYWEEAKSEWCLLDDGIK